MRLLTKFWQIISGSTDADVESKRHLYSELAKLDPKKFYIENIRSVLNISFQQAEQIALEGVTAGRFKQGFEIVGPDGSVLKTIDSDDTEIPAVVEGWELIDGDYEPVEYQTKTLKRNPYFRLAQLR